MPRNVNFSRSSKSRLNGGRSRTRLARREPSRHSVNRGKRHTVSRNQSKANVNKISSTSLHRGKKTRSRPVSRKPDKHSSRRDIVRRNKPSVSVSKLRRTQEGKRSSRRDLVRPKPSGTSVHNSNEYLPRSKPSLSVNKLRRRPSRKSLERRKPSETSVRSYGNKDFTTIVPPVTASKVRRSQLGERASREDLGSREPPEMTDRRNSNEDLPARNDAHFTPQQPEENDKDKHTDIDKPSEQLIDVAPKSRDEKDRITEIDSSESYPQNDVSLVYYSTNKIERKPSPRRSLSDNSESVTSHIEDVMSLGSFERVSPSSSTSSSNKSMEHTHFKNKSLEKKPKKENPRNFKILGTMVDFGVHDSETDRKFIKCDKSCKMCGKTPQKHTETDTESLDKKSVEKSSGHASRSLPRIVVEKELSRIASYGKVGVSHWPYFMPMSLLFNRKQKSQGATDVKGRSLNAVRSLCCLSPMETSSKMPTFHSDSKLIRSEFSVSETTIFEEAESEKGHSPHEESKRKRGHSADKETKRKREYSPIASGLKTISNDSQDLTAAQMFRGTVTPERRKSSKLDKGHRPGSSARSRAAHDPRKDYREIHDGESSRRYKSPPEWKHLPHRLDKAQAPHKRRDHSTFRGSNGPYSEGKSSKISPEYSFGSPWTRLSHLTVPGRSPISRKRSPLRESVRKPRHSPDRRDDHRSSSGSMRPYGAKGGRHSKHRRSSHRSPSRRSDRGSDDSVKHSGVAKNRSTSKGRKSEKHGRRQDKKNRGSNSTINEVVQVVSEVYSIDSQTDLNAPKKHDGYDAEQNRHDKPLPESRSRPHDRRRGDELSAHGSPNVLPKGDPSQKTAHDGDAQGMPIRKIFSRKTIEITKTLPEDQKESKHRRDHRSPKDKHRGKSPGSVLEIKRSYVSISSEVSERSPSSRDASPYGSKHKSRYRDSDMSRQNFHKDQTADARRSAISERGSLTEEDDRRSGVSERPIEIGGHKSSFGSTRGTSRLNKRGRLMPGTGSGKTIPSYSSNFGDNGPYSDRMREYISRHRPEYENRHQRRHRGEYAPLYDHREYRRESYNRDSYTPRYGRMSRRGQSDRPEPRPQSDRPDLRPQSNWTDLRPQSDRPRESSQVGRAHHRPRKESTDGYEASNERDDHRRRSDGKTHNSFFSDYGSRSDRKRESSASRSPTDQYSPRRESRYDRSSIARRPSKSSSPTKDAKRDSVGSERRPSQNGPLSDTLTNTQSPAQPLEYAEKDIQTRRPSTQGQEIAPSRSKVHFRRRQSYRLYDLEPKPSRHSRRRRFTKTSRTIIRRKSRPSMKKATSKGILRRKPSKTSSKSRSNTNIPSKKSRSSLRPSRSRSRTSAHPSRSRSRASPHPSRSRSRESIRPSKSRSGSNVRSSRSRQNAGWSPSGARRRDRSRPSRSPRSTSHKTRHRDSIYPRRKRSTRSILNPGHSDAFTSTMSLHSSVSSNSP